MSPNLYLGLIQFGSENFYAANKTYFAVSDYNISFTPLDLNPNGDGPTGIPALHLPSLATRMASQGWIGMLGRYWCSVGIFLSWELFMDLLL